MGRSSAPRVLCACEESQAVTERLRMMGIEAYSCDLLPDAEKHRIHSMPPSPQRGMLRSKTYPGIADAMATQWGRYLIESEKEDL